MASLLDNLTSSFTSNGSFDLEAAFHGISTAAGGVTPRGVSLDEDALSSIGAQLGQGGGFGGLGGAVTGIVGVAESVAGGLVQPQGLVGPLSGALAHASTFATADPRSVLRLFEDAAASSGGATGMAALAAPLGALQGVRSDPLVATALQLLAAAGPGALPLDTTVARLGDGAGALAALVNLLGALMSTDALTREVASTAQSVHGMLDAATADAAARRIATAGSGLAALVAGADPSDEAHVDATVAAVAEYAAALRGASGALVRGLAFGEATVVGADLDTVSAGIAQAATLLNETSLAPVHAFATTAAGWVEPFLRIDLGSPAVSVDAFVAELTGLVGEIGTAIDRIDPRVVSQPVARALETALAPLREVETLANETTATIRSAFQTAQQAIAAIDLRPVTDAIHAALQPVIDALHALEQLIAEAETELEALANDVKQALDTISDTLDHAAAAIHDAFSSVKTVVEGLHLETLQATLEQDMQTVTGALESAHVEPYFDTAITAIDAAKTVVAAVPLSILPDSTREELEEAVQPIKDLDFDTDVRDVLEQELDAIMTTLDTDVLDEVDAAYHEVVAFLESIDPRPFVEQFERDDFDPMLARIRAVDPTEMLKPISDAIDEVKSAIAGVDLRRDVVQPLDDAFGRLEDAFGQLDPGALLAPLERQLSQVRRSIVDALQLDTWGDRLAAVDPFVTQLLARLDFDTVVTLLDGAWLQLAPAPGPPGPSVLATVVSGLLEGTGLRLRLDSFDTVVRWIGGADASAEVAQRLGDAATALDDVVAVAQSVDPRAIVASAQPTYDAVLAAVRSLPETSLLRDRLEAVLAGASPLDLLGGTVDNRDRYLASVTALAAAVRGGASSARGEVNAIAHGLRDALRPLAVIPDRVRAIFRRFGLDVTGKSLRQLVRELFLDVTPSRLLAPLSPAIAQLKAKVAALVHDGLVAPATDALTTIRGAVDALDISFIRTGLQGLHDEIAADIHALRPSVVLADVLTAFDETKATIAAFDPLAPVREAIDAMKAAIERVAGAYRPTVLFAELLDVYDEVVHALGVLDVRSLLEPVLKALDDIKTQLDNGLDGTGVALKGLQEALP